MIQQNYFLIYIQQNFRSLSKSFFRVGKNEETIVDAVTVTRKWRLKAQNKRQR